MNILTKDTFINNNIFSDFLHSTGVVLHVHPSLQESMLLHQPSKWCNMVLPNWALAFPTLGSLQYLELFSTPSHQALMVSTLRWHHTCAHQRQGYWAKPLLGLTTYLCGGFGYPTLGRSRLRDSVRSLFSLSLCFFLSNSLFLSLFSPQNCIPLSFFSFSYL